MAAGYSRVSARVGANRLLTKAAVQAEIQARQAQDSHRLQIDRETAIQGLLDAIAEARAQGNPAAMIQGWKAIAGMLGLMAPQRVQVEARVGESRFERMSDAELLAIVAGSTAGDSVA